MRQGWERGEVRPGFWWGNLTEKANFEGLLLDGIILKWIFKNLVENALTRLMWVRIGTGGGLLWMR